MEDYNQSLGIVYAGTHGTLMSVVLFCSYGAIRLDGILSISLGWIGVNLLMFLAIITDQYGQINRSSKMALEAISRRQVALQSADKQLEQKWLKKKALCLRDFKIRVGSTFFFDKLLLLTTFQILLSNITNLLLMH